MTYAFIRHGQTDWNLEGRLQGSRDIPLNDTGRAQAHEAAQGLKGAGWSVIVSSPKLRARETAEIIAAELGLTLGPAYDELVERDYGVLEGTSAAEAEAAHPNRDYPGAETIESTVERGRAALARIADDYPDDEVIIVCHGTIIRYTLASLAGHIVDRPLNGSVSTFRLDGEAWEVLTVNGAPLVAVAETDAG